MLTMPLDRYIPAPSWHHLHTLETSAIPTAIISANSANISDVIFVHVQGIHFLARWMGGPCLSLLKVRLKPMVIRLPVSCLTNPSKLSYPITRPLHHVSRQIPANFSWCMIWDRDVNMVKFNYPSWILSCLYIGMYFAVDFAVPVSDLGQVRIARRNSGDGSPIYVITHSMY